MPANIRIRTARVETDLPAVVRLINPYEAQAVSVEQARAWFEFNPPGRITRRLVAVDAQDAPIGYSVINHETTWPAGRFNAWLVVDPAARCQGIGSALWDASLAFLQEQGADRVGSEVQDHDAPSLGFAGRRGFRIDRRLFHSTLDLSTFDETPYLPGIARLEAEGVRFCALSDFPDTPATRRSLYDLNVANVLDIPGNMGVPWTFAEFEQFVLSAPWFSRAGQLLALDGDAWVGLAAVSLDLENHSAYNQHTGVLRAYRGRKIAQALKVLAARYARQHGALRINTDNDSLNAPILSVNQKMGYQPQPGRYMLVRERQ